ncbi:hypothetical protein C4D60_Mb07t03200 [Musa balbisiana]|uniref:Uncharacterized protein n=1 Tax=Musa balbisiana TaxID=52838 RepID=A0A4S8JCL0_MUSBA|nr:hypothetical protein C4D60_Mb07t03200 [Musa balbisiana]
MRPCLQSIVLLLSGDNYPPSHMSLTPKNIFKPPAYPHQGVSEPHSSGADTHRYDVSHRLTPTLISPTSGATISATVDTSIAMSTSTHRDPSIDAMLASQDYLSTNLIEHTIAFYTQIFLYGTLNALMCSAFLIMPRGPALEWYTSLKLLSFSSFA